MLKSKTEAYDGRGNYPVMNEDAVSIAYKALGNRPLYAEKWADFEKELAVMVVKTKDGTLSYPTVETVHEDSICKLVYAPARISSHIRKSAEILAKKAISAFSGKVSARNKISPSQIFKTDRKFPGCLWCRDVPS
jgi:phosphoribosylaminoimidazole carboxylase